MEKIIEELTKLNKQLDDINRDLQVIVDDMKKVEAVVHATNAQPIWGNEQDEKNIYSED